MTQSDQVIPQIVDKVQDKSPGLFSLIILSYE